MSLNFFSASSLFSGFLSGCQRSASLRYLSKVDQRTAAEYNSCTGGSWPAWLHCPLPDPILQQMLIFPAPYTCHPAQRWHSRLYPSQLMLVLGLATPDGCKAKLTRLAWLIRPKTVTHPSTNRSKRRVTSFMRRTTLYSFRQATNNKCIQKSHLKGLQ